MNTMAPRSLAFLRKNYWIAQKVERWQKIWNPKEGGPPGVRIDLFGIGDLVAMGPFHKKGVLPSILMVQCCDGANLSSHLQKCLESKNLALWCHSGGGFEIHSWSKRGSRGKRKLWTLKIMRAVLMDNTVCFEEIPTPAEPSSPCEPSLNDSTAKCHAKESNVYLSID